MCAIAGLFPLDNSPRLPALEQMLRAQAHRGPDDQHQVQLDGGALGARRLAIVDREGGRQPVRYGPVWVALNGEVYNHEGLRKELVARGRVFETESDTEVVAALIDEAGVDRALSRLEGQFAIAAWHTGQRRLWLARDRLGQKPLYWTSRSGELRFASELKGLLCLRDQPRQLDPVALQQLLMFEFVPAPRSIYQGVQKLEAGTLLEVDASGQRHRRWWTPPIPGLGRSRLAEERWQKSVDISLQMAVKRRLRTDLPVAWFLSGGIDSSAVASFGAELLQEPLNTFAVTFDEASFDESGPASLMARTLGAKHTPLRFTHAELPHAMSAMQEGQCEPMADGSWLSTWFISRAVRDAGFKLAVTGDGADEHFAGYPTYPAHRAAALAARGRGVLGRVARRLPTSTRNLSTGYKARRFVQGLGLSAARRNQVWLGACLPAEAVALLGADHAQAWAEVDRWGALAAQAPDPVSAAMYMDQRLYLGEGVLAKADRCSMLNSLELRSPFLDHHLVELAAPIPANMKMRGMQTKALLRRALAHRLPQEILDRPKKGFGTPLGPWLAGPSAGLLTHLGDRLASVVSASEVRRLVDEHQRGHRDHRRRLWTLLVLASWLEGPWGPKG